MTRSTSLAVWSYRHLLRAFPPAVRAACADDMARQFGDAYGALSGRPLARARLWILAAADALWHGLLERLAVRGTVTDHSSRYVMPQDPRPGVMARTVSFVQEAALRDLRLSFRRLRRAPGFTFVATLTLALGIGATTAIFSVVYAVLLKPLPFPDSGRLVYLYQTFEGTKAVFAPPNFLDVQSRAKTLSSASAADATRYVLTGQGPAVSVTGGEVTAGFFETLAVPPHLGRVLQPGENETGRTQVAVLGHAMWRNRFGARPDVVGQRMSLDGVSYEIVGVMPQGFEWPYGAEFWVPIEYSNTFRVTNRGAWYLDTVARLAPGVTLPQAVAEMDLLGRQLEAEYPVNAGVGITAGRLLDEVVGDTRRTLVVLLAAVALVLLIACANVANLMLARASSREDEMAVRVALGAGRLQLARQLGVESALLALIGGAAGLGLAYAGTTALVAVMPAGIPRIAGVAINPVVMLFTLGATLVTGLLFGMLPALHASSRSVAESINERGRSGMAGWRGQRTRSTLVVVETALAVILLAGAGLLMRSFVKLSQVDPGFRIDHAVTFSLALPELGYPDDPTRAAFYDRFRDALSATPGVEAVGAVLSLPPGPQLFGLSFDIAGRPPHPRGEDPTLEVRVADADYFRVMGIAVERGRAFAPADRQGTTPVAVLTASAVRQFFKDEDPIGARITLGWRRNGERVAADVVGVVADVKSFGLDVDVPPQIYLPLAQVPVSSMAWVVRTAVEPETMFSAIRQVVATADPNLPINRPETLEHRVRESTASRRFSMLLLGLFAAVALVLAAVGIFGVLSYLVSERTREFGVRIALGAPRSAVVGMVLRRAIALAVAGVAIGTLGALGIARVMDALLFDLSPNDPWSFAGAAASLLAVAIVAAWIPAHRATTADPLLALRG